MSGPKDIRRSTKPTDRLTQLCDAMIAELENQPQYREGTDKCIIFLDDGIRGGLVLHGYDDDKEAIVDLFRHLQAIFKANGMNLDLVAIPDDARDLE